MREGEDEDAALMIRAGRGDLDSFEKLVRRHEKPLANFFVRNGVYSDTEDLVQQTFLKIYNIRKSYKPSAKFTTFLYTVARHALIDHLRAVERLESLHDRAGADMAENAIVRPYGGEVSDAETALEILSPELRETVVLVIMQGMAYGEAAEILDVPLGTVKSRIHAALAQMRAHITQQKPCKESDSSRQARAES